MTIAQNIIMGLEKPCTYYIELGSLGNFKEPAKNIDFHFCTAKYDL